MLKKLIFPSVGVLVFTIFGAGYYYQNPCKIGGFLCERAEQAAANLQDQQSPRYLEFQTAWLNQPAKILYPAYAYTKNIEGSVVLVLTLAADGKLINKSVKKSSGTPLLDNAALTAADSFDFNVAAFGQVDFPFSKDLKVTFKKEGQ